MADHHGRTAGITDWPLPAAQAFFVTSFRGGTGAHLVEVQDDRITTHYRHGGTHALPLAAIGHIETFDVATAPPVYGVHLARRDEPGCVGYLFDDDATRHTFVRAVERRLRPDAR